MMDLVELQNEIHTQNVEKGWWDEQRPFEVFACLFHSELSEAVEGHRKGLMDDHLPHREMWKVEVADFVIRCMDWLGSVGNDEYDVELDDDYLDMAIPKFLANLHLSVSQTYRLYTAGADVGTYAVGVASCVEICFTLDAKLDLDLQDTILEKVEYNKNRPDHSREARAAEGGKKY